MKMDAIRVGAFDVRRVPEMTAPLMPVLEFFPELTVEMLGTVRSLLPVGNLTSADEMILSFHSYVVNTGRYTILIDTCCGNDKQRPSRPAFSNLATDYLEALAAAGVHPEAVDYVMCTHLHWDHVGWNTRLVSGVWSPTFPNAKYIMARREYDFWNDAYTRDPSGRHGPGFADSVAPIVRAEKAILVEDDFEIDAGVWLEPCHGHSPGHVVVNLESGDGRGLMTGDAIHHRLQLHYPALSTIADTDEDLARETRTALLERHADTGHILFPSHFPPPSFGSIRRQSNGEGYIYSSDTE
ncbi:MAG: MBL fold metallo-hydrolase [Hyphomicrobiaceae bacterium]